MDQLIQWKGNYFFLSCGGGGVNWNEYTNRYMWTDVYNERGPSNGRHTFNLALTLVSLISLFFLTLGFSNKFSWFFVFLYFLFVWFSVDTGGVCVRVCLCAIECEITTTTKMFRQERKFYLTLRDFPLFSVFQLLLNFRTWRKIQITTKLEEKRKQNVKNIKQRRQNCFVFVVHMHVCM